ncbi:Type IV fimbrial biogenesis protein PilY1 [Labilithrix luteola]|uniref:Type IV fimbrial biogenesis protein PilY1 n=1 Tax=Labilithrix luteola TaxID=1391654 RepID=A0A0K1PKM1_9BACT|nr:YCF48-related protein [Labilithrix luteola]AKU93659.1 Type IV fimbrial biogenesis protein PilY1 [Labilithrix luteola]
MRRLSSPNLAFVALLGFAPTAGLASCAENAAPPSEVTPDIVEAPDSGAVLPSSVDCPPDAFCPIELPEGAPLTLNGIWGSGPNDVWIVGSPSTSIHWDGSHFARVAVDKRRSLLGVWGSDNGDVWSFGTSQTLWHTRGVEDGSAEWTSSSGKTGINPQGYPTPILAMWGASTTDVWAVGASLRASNGVTPLPSVLHCDGWRDGEPNWTASPTSDDDSPVVEPITFNAICGAERSGVWIVGEGGKTRYTERWQAEATRWTHVNSNSSRTLYAAWCSPAGEVWAAGEGGTIHRFVRGDGGDAYSESASATPTTVSLRALWGTSANDIWAVGDEATVLHWDGTTWTLASPELSSSTKADLFAVWGSGEGDVWIAGRDVLLKMGSTGASRKIP